ncbi:MAG: hypothetical protein KDD44_03890 [Bdellovibrionales bacterium]|nr:hypothetical protein [Bdellovibrionales bacterium]
MTRAEEIRKQLPLEAARRQKRIKFWSEEFSRQTPNPEYRDTFQELLKTYQLLLAKLFRAPDDESLVETFDRVQATERDITRLYEHARLLTSNRALID